MSLVVIDVEPIRKKMGDKEEKPFSIRLSRIPILNERIARIIQHGCVRKRVTYKVIDVVHYSMNDPQDDAGRVYVRELHAIEIPFEKE